MSGFALALHLGSEALAQGHELAPRQGIIPVQGVPHRALSLGVVWHDVGFSSNGAIGLHLRARFTLASIIFQ
jgi:hypothetical protein